MGAPYDFMAGASDTSYGTGVWVARVEGLASHLRIIRDHLPDDATWLRGQVEAGLREAQRYISDPAPVDAA